jgi:hypothetical protein
LCDLKIPEKCKVLQRRTVLLVNYANLGEVVKSSCVPNFVDFVDAAVRILTGDQPWTLPIDAPGATSTAQIQAAVSCA